MTANNTITIISSIATLSVSITIAIFTYQLSKAQKNIAKEKLKLDLFDRRYDLFKKIKSHFHLIMTTNKCDIDENEFLKEKYSCLQDIYFLLGEETHNELHKIYGELTHYFTEKRKKAELVKHGGIFEGEERKEMDDLNKKLESLTIKTEKNQDRLPKIFAKYMSFEDLKIK